MYRPCSIDDIAVIRYVSIRFSLFALYSHILANKDALEANEFSCSWEFVGNPYKLSLTDNLLDDSSGIGIRVATIENGILHLDVRYSVRRNAFFMFGKMHVFGNKERYQNLTQALKKLDQITGIEFRLDYFRC